MDNTCGLGTFRPKWLRKFATVKSFMAIYGLLGTIQAMAFIYLVATLTTIEKRFKIPSKITGIVLTGNEISQILLSLILSYHGSHRNRPRWIAWGVVFQALSCFMVALPHFIYGAGTDALELTKEFMGSDIKNINNSSSLQMCLEEERYDNCHVQELAGDLSIVPVILLFLSQFILGIGNTLYFALGQTYLDDNSKKTDTPILLAWSLALRTFGPALGFVLGFLCLNIYVDPFKNPLIDKKDPRWLGAWWLGWLFLGLTMIIFAFLIVLFPRHLPQSSDKKSKEEQRLAPKSCKVDPVIVIEKDIPRLKDFPAALKRLLKNKILMFNNTSGVFYILGLSGYINYLAKYLEVQFQGSSLNTVIAGPAMLVGMVAGFIIAGYTIARFKPGPRYLTGWNVIVGLVSVSGIFIVMNLDCPITEVHSFSPTSDDFKLDGTCNEQCNCDNVKYAPVCDLELQKTYFSPCHAGCTDTYIDNTKHVFSNCSCTDPQRSLADGPCMADCSSVFNIFLLCIIGANLLGSSSKIGNMLVNFRCVDVKDKSFAQGLLLWMISLFGFIPGPIIFGILIDSTCLVWNMTCNNRGHCYTYDRKKFRIYINTAAIVFTSIGIIFDIGVWYYSGNIVLYENAPSIPAKEIESIKKDKKNSETTEKDNCFNNKGV